MRGRARCTLRRVRRNERPRRELLWRLWRAAATRRARRLDARPVPRRRVASGRTATAHGSLLRPRRLDAARPAARPRGVALHGRAVPQGNPPGRPRAQLSTGPRSLPAARVVTGPALPRETV